MESKDREENTKNTYDTTDEYHLLTRTTFYFGLYNFALIAYSVIYSFFLARLLSLQNWGILILANSFILIITQISRIFPPSLERTLYYYIPKYNVLNQKEKMKSFMKISIFLKLIALFPIFFISLFIFQIITPIRFGGNPSLLFILSPLIIIDGFNFTLVSINLGFNRSKINFYLYLTRILIVLITLLSYYLLNISISIEFIAFILVISYFVPFIINCIFILITYLKLQTTSEKALSFKEVMKITIKYGTPLLFNYFLASFWLEFQKIGIGTFSSEDNVTGFNAATSYSNISRAIMIALNTSLVISFSRIYTTKKIQKTDSFYNLIVKYGLFFVSLISGLLIILTDFSLRLIYGVDYLQFSLIFKLLMFSIPFLMLTYPFDAIISAREKTKILAPIKLFTVGIQLILFFILLIYFDVLGAVIGMLLGEFIGFIFYIILHFKVIKIKIQLRSIILQFLILFVSIIIPLFLELIGMNDFYYSILTTLNLTILKSFPLFSIILFLLIFFVLNFLLKIITKQDMESFESFFSERGLLSKIISKISKILKKIAFF